MNISLVTGYNGVNDNGYDEPVANLFGTSSNEWTVIQIDPLVLSNLSHTQTAQLTWTIVITIDFSLSFLRCYNYNLTRHIEISVWYVLVIIFDNWKTLQQSKNAIFIGFVYNFEADDSVTFVYIKMGWFLLPGEYFKTESHSLAFGMFLTMPKRSSQNPLSHSRGMQHKIWKTTTKSRALSNRFIIAHMKPRETNSVALHILNLYLWAVTNII